MSKKAKKSTPGSRDTTARAKQVLRPYRLHIDALDRRLITLIAERFAVVRRVAEVKHGYDIPAFIVERVDEVRENAIRDGVKKGIDRDFLWSLYSLMIYHSCATEERIHEKLAHPKRKRK